MNSTKSFRPAVSREVDMTIVNLLNKDPILGLRLRRNTVKNTRIVGSSKQAGPS